MTFTPRSEFLNVMQTRGFVANCTDYQGLDDALMQGSPVAAYIGYDATAKSLHVGHLMNSWCCAGCKRQGTSRSR